MGHRASSVMRTREENSWSPSVKACNKFDIPACAQAVNPLVSFLFLSRDLQTKNLVDGDVQSGGFCMSWILPNIPPVSSADGHQYELIEFALTSSGDADDDADDASPGRERCC